MNSQPFPPLAAFNSPPSTALSGDADAIREVENFLQSVNKFARTLNVDTAYHSHQIYPCSQPYIQALEACNIQSSSQISSKWYFSVYTGQEMNYTHSTALKAEYWKDNMASAVQFSQVPATAIESTSFDMIVEVGPYPALKGPAMQTITDVRQTSTEIPYVGLLNRGNSGIEALAGAIGSFWAYLDAKSSNPGEYVRLFGNSKQFTPLKSLPNYCFDRTQTYWAASRFSKSN